MITTVPGGTLELRLEHDAEVKFSTFCIGSWPRGNDHAAGQLSTGKPTDRRYLRRAHTFALTLTMAPLPAAAFNEDECETVSIVTEC